MRGEPFPLLRSAGDLSSFWRWGEIPRISVVERGACTIGHVADGLLRPFLLSVAVLALYRGFLALVGGSVRQFCSRGCSSSVVFATSVSGVIDDRECISSHRGFCGCCWRIHCHHGYDPSQSGGGEEFVCLYKTYAPRNEPVENHGVRGNAGACRAVRAEGIIRRSQDHRTTICQQS